MLIRKAGSLVALMGMAVLMGGCTYFIADFDFLPEEPPAAPSDAPPQILSIDVDPTAVLAGLTTRLAFSIVIEDINGDIGPEQVTLRRVIRARSGNIVFDEEPKLVDVDVDVDGTRGTLEYLIDVYIPDNGQGTFEFEIQVSDSNGHFSESVFITLEIQSVF